MKFLSFLVVFLLLTCVSLATPISEYDKRSIYEVYNPAKQSVGTGFMLLDSSLAHVLVTCKHVVQDSNGNYVDSIFVRRNRLLPTGEVISDTSEFVVHLKVAGKSYLVQHPNPDVDLVMLPVVHWNATLFPDERVAGFYSHWALLSKEELDRKGLNEGTDVEVIGFSFSGLLLPKNKCHYHFSRFGKIGLYTTDQFTLIIDGEPKTANFILLDMTSRPGDSGSPVLAHLGKTPFLIGFLAGSSFNMEFAVAYPVYYLYELMEIMRHKYRATYKIDKK